MPTTYSTRSNARRAALATFGREALDGIDFVLQRTEDGRFALVAATRPQPAAPVAAAPVEEPAAAPVADAPTAAAPARQRADSKQALVLVLLRRPEGATTADIMAATGWQPHTCRGFIAGAAKKKLGLTVTAAKEEGRGTVYRIPA